jgi:hypothetical protein
MEGRYGNATSDQNNLAEPWRDWFVLYAFGTRLAQKLTSGLAELTSAFEGKAAMMQMRCDVR